MANGDHLFQRISFWLGLKVPGDPPGWNLSMADGCSSWPEGVWGRVCCNEHDQSYAWGNYISSRLMKEERSRLVRWAVLFCLFCFRVIADYILAKCAWRRCRESTEYVRWRGIAIIAYRDLAWPNSILMWLGVRVGGAAHFYKLFTSGFFPK